MIKLIPYFDVPLSVSKKIKKEGNELRKILAIAKSEGEMILRRKKLNTLMEIIQQYFDILIVP